MNIGWCILINYCRNCSSLTTQVNRNWTVLSGEKTIPTSLCPVKGEKTLEEETQLNIVFWWCILLVMMFLLCSFLEDEFELTDFEDFDDENVDIFADPGSASGVCLYPAACRVIYSYQVLHIAEHFYISYKNTTLNLVVWASKVVLWTLSPQYMYRSPLKWSMLLATNPNPRPIVL